MDTQAFDILEQRVTQVLDKLNRLRSENDGLRQQVQEWESRYEEANTKLDSLTRERDKLMENQPDQEKEERIRQKVVELLARLEEAA